VPRNVSDTCCGVDEHCIVYYTNIFELSEIANVKSTNFLGVVIDNTLSWEDHVEKKL
jgi:hypothetical protein